MHTQADDVVHLLSVGRKLKRPVLSIHFSLHPDVVVLMQRFVTRFAWIS